MIETLLQAILEQVDQPKKDLEKNLRALLNESVEKLDLVSKQELERQKIALNLANQRLAALQQQMSTLEKMVQDQK
ncbi:MAG: accessory factor UbiK family protein [Acinetobacter sp.]|jgi:BMFP domain-containing protein YqiC|uniref:accessory factor UbiK family protein n=1 Tax=unclassified Acinetobacter TaxID=196816 RepID=UPI000B3C4DC8|nr:MULTISPECIES: accessory factor UbiK family protein [unclassified Acinetobacter]AZM37342.1 accessory factor UbiK family protein [Acinetobacter baumannii]AVZ86738.1 membrane fusogenic activity [Acinetobacter sp. WCHA45]MCE1272276.1 accessory factor UbiK family protein [Acinetobacter sp.]MCL5767954.1 accessory factor UbiK family protein [Acinetobacter sp. ANC5681]NWK82323.1 accessory factor UbiK family protein [Acinetobacter sp. SwsAc4]